MYDKEALREIRRIVRNYNRRLARLQKARVPFLPEKVSAKKIIETYTPENIRLRLNELLSFRAAEAREVVQTDKGRTSAYNFRILTERLPRAIDKLEKEYETFGNLQPTVRGKREPFTNRQIGADAYSDTLRATLKAYRSLNIRDYDSGTFRRRLKGTETVLYEQEGRTVTMRENYIKALETLDSVFGSGSSSARLSQIESALRNMKPDDFYKMYQNERMMPDIFEDSHMLFLLAEGNYNDDDWKHYNLTRTRESYESFLDYFDNLRDIYEF